MKEFQLIAELAAKLGDPPVGIVGIGDDCAVVACPDGGARKLLYTVDALIDGCHFDRQISSPFEIGYKAAAVNISDIAAMGGDPKYLLISLQLPADIASSYIDELYCGIKSCAEKFGAYVIGGDTTASPCLALSVTAIGEVVGEPLLRSGVMAGDLVYTSGVIGEAWAGLSIAKGQLLPHRVSNKVLCLDRHKSPQPQVPLGKVLQQQNLATAAIDISDGLVAEAMHLAECSGVTIELFLDKVPLPFAENASQEELFEAITGGDDYQLLFSSAVDKSELSHRLGPVGEQVVAVGRAVAQTDEPVILYTAEEGIVLELNGRQAGYQHL